MPDLLICCALALACGFAIDRARGHGAVSVDESYLWYGALRVREGRLPLRDFRAYEPGRYWWVAAFMRVLGPRVEAVRLAALSFYVGALAAALAALRIADLDWMTTGLIAVLLSAWAFPVYKLFEPALLLFGFLCAVLLIRDPGAGTAALAGVVVGIGAVFGLNYGLYLGAGLALVAGAVILSAPDLDVARVLGAGCVGALVGAAPLWVLLLASPGFRNTLVDRRVRAPLQRGTTNLPLPVPWPWRPAPWAWRKRKRAAVLAAGVLFAAMPALGLAAVVAMVLLPWPSLQSQAAWIAAGAMLAAAQHHAFSRADLVHLCQVVPLLVIGGLALGPASWNAMIAAAATLVLASIALWSRGLKRLRRPAEAAGKPPRMQILADTVRTLRARHLRDGEPVLALPQLIGLYVMLDLRSPVYDTYCVYPAPEADQARMLAEIERSGVRLAVIQDEALDGRDDLRFAATHPRVWAFLEQAFTRLPPVAALPGFHFFLRATPRDADTAGVEDPISAVPRTT